MRGCPILNILKGSDLPHVTVICLQPLILNFSLSVRFQSAVSDSCFPSNGDELSDSSLSEVLIANTVPVI